MADLVRSLLLVLVAAHALAAGTEVQESKRLRPTRKQLESRGRLVKEGAAQSVTERLQRYLQEVRRAHDAGDWETFDRTTLSLLHFASRVPVDHLALYQPELMQLLEKRGAEPYLSYIIDYGTRLASVRTETALRQFDQLRNHPRLTPKRSHVKRRVYLRDKGRRAFRAYSENVGLAAAILAFSDLGRDVLLGPARAAGDLLPFLAMTKNCDNTRGARGPAKPSLFRDAFRVDTCDLLLAQLRDKVGSSPAWGGGSELSGALADIGTNGFGMSGSCLETLSGDKSAEMTRQVEDYMACRNAERTTPPSGPGPETLMAATSSGNTETSGGTEHFSVHRDASGKIVGSEWAIKTSEGTVYLDHRNGACQRL